MGIIEEQEVKKLVTSPRRQILVIEDPTRIQIILEETRRTILRVLGNGIEDESGKRFAMSVPEITEQMNALHPTVKGKDKPRYKQTAIYHHIIKLQSNEFIESCDGYSATSSRSPTTFYRRTAPVFVISNVLDASEEFDEVKEEIKQRFKEKSLKLIQTFNLDLSPLKYAEFQDLINEFLNIGFKIHSEIAKKIPGIEQEEAMRTFNFIRKIWACTNPEMTKIAQKIKKFLEESPKHKYNIVQANKTK
ncbi:MAG: hypothetical protein ACXAC7_03420 [Candidatus Hodarchaeales archaeon]|jgi:hypothetical protein